MSLADSLEPLTWDAADSLVESEEPDLPLEEVGELSLDLEHKISGIAIILLLTKADSDGFLHNLIRAAKIWERYLERGRAEAGGTDDHNFCAGIFAPVLDALAAREFTLATKLCELAPTEYRPGHEAETDYCYGRILCGLTTRRLPAAEVASLIDRCANTGDEMSVARVECCRPLLEHAEEAFEEAFAALVSARQREVSADRRRGQVESAPILAHRELFVEGIALLNLAERLGFVQAAEYPLCPSLARLPMSRPFPGVR